MSTPAPPKLSYERQGQNLRLDWAEPPGARCALMACDAVDGSAPWRLSPKAVHMARTQEYFRLEVGPTGEFELPGGGELQCRHIARRADGLNAYAYNAGVLRVALFRDVGPPFTFDIPGIGYTHGMEVAFAGSTLYVVTGEASVGTVAAVEVSSDWPPVVGPEVAVHMIDQPDGRLRWPAVCGLKSGGMVAQWYLQGGDQHSARIVYRHPFAGLPFAGAPEWSDYTVDFPALLPTNNAAGRNQLCQHPATGQVWLLGIRDSKHELPCVVFDARETLVKAFDKVLTNGYPMNGVVDPCAFDGELPQWFRVVPHGDKLRVTGNAQKDFVVNNNTDAGWMKLTKLVTFDVAGDGAVTLVGYTGNYCERCSPDYAYVAGDVLMNPTPPDTDHFPRAKEAVLTRDSDGAVVSELGRWISVGQGAREVAYLRRDGKAVVNRL